MLVEVVSVPKFRATKMCL